MGDAGRATSASKPGRLYKEIREPYFFGYVRDQLIRKYGAETVRSGGLSVYTTIVPRWQKAAQEAIRSTLTDPADPAAAVISIDPANGAIRAMTAVIPGRSNNQFNLLSQARRQPGSTFKTFVLAAAIEKGIDPDTSYYVSAPFTYKPVENGNCDDGSWWCVKTYDSSYNGWTSISRATLRSDNTVYAQLTLDVGPDKVGEMAQKLGVRSPLKVGGHYVPAMGLGSIAVSPLDMASAYATLAAGGIYSEPTAIRKVVLPNGKEDTKAGWGSPKRTRVIPDGVAWKVTQILEDNVSYGTGVRAAFGRPAAGKTGTTDKHADAWFVGYTPDLATAVWMGYQAGEIPMENVHGIAVSGGSFPAEIWRLMMERTIGLRAASRLPRPEGLSGLPDLPPRPARAELRPLLRRPDHLDRDRQHARPTRRRHATTPPAKRTPDKPAKATTPTQTVRRALAAGVAVLALVAAACALAWRPDSPLVPRHGGNVSGTAPLFLALLIAAFAAYLARAATCSGARRPRIRAVIVLAAAIQLVPLAAPLLLSTDAWTYWSYGWIGARSGRQPVLAIRRRTFPDNPALDYMGSAWLGTTTVYGPAFTLASEPLAVVAGDSDAVAAWSYKALAAAAALAAALLAGRLARRRAFAIALVGWNPILAVHLAGGGHNDAWVGALILAALALSASRRAAGRWRRSGSWRSRSSGCRSSSSRSARSSRGRAGRPQGVRGLVGAAAGIALGATVLYGGAWPLAIFPLVGQRGARDELCDPAPARAARAAGRPRARARDRGARGRARRARARRGPWARAARARRLPRARDDSLPRRLVPRLGRSARRRRGGRRRDGRRARALRVPPAADDPDLRPCATRRPSCGGR